MSIEINSRVSAICSFKEGHMETFGDGVYLGMKVPNQSPFNEIGMTNPCILLDSGKYVWGMECWWGPIEKVKAKYGDRVKTTETVEPSNTHPLEESEVSNG